MRLDYCPDFEIRVQFTLFVKYVAIFQSHGQGCCRLEFNRQHASCYGSRNTSRMWKRNNFLHIWINSDANILRVVYHIAFQLSLTAWRSRDSAELTLLFKDNMTNHSLYTWTSAWTNRQWNGNIVILMKFLSKAARQIVIVAIFIATIDGNFMEMTFWYECCDDLPDTKRATHWGVCASFAYPPSALKSRVVGRCFSWQWCSSLGGRYSFIITIPIFS